jgi:lipoprotein-releasing system permease protein
MTPVFLIAWRFFLESKRSMILSAIGVIAGVGFFICGQAQTQGFQNFFIDALLGSKGAIVISDRFQKSFTNILNGRKQGMIAMANPQARKYYPGILNAYRIIRTLEEFPNVVAAAPVLEGNVDVRAGFRSELCRLNGIDIAMHSRATDLPYQIIEGQFDDFRADTDSVMVGSLLARKLDMFVGQNLFLTGPGNEPRRMRLVAIYETGINVIDEKQVYVHQRTAQNILRRPFEISFIMVKLKDSMRAPQDAEAFEDLLSHQSRPWQEREKGNLQIFRTLRISAGLAISGIILLAGFGIFNVLTMAVMEKTKEIAILRSMGYSRGDISGIFLWQGFFVACIGIVLGWGFGAALTQIVTYIPIRIRGIFKADHFIVAWDIHHYLIAGVLAMIAVLVASYIPARRAAQLQPVDILRGTSQ